MIAERLETETHLVENRVPVVPKIPNQRFRWRLLHQGKEKISTWTGQRRDRGRIQDVSRSDQRWCQEEGCNIFVYNRRSLFDQPLVIRRDANGKILSSGWTARGFSQ